MIFRQFIDAHRDMLNNQWSDAQWLCFEQFLNETEASIFQWLVLEKDIPDMYKDLVLCVKMKTIQTNNETEFNNYAVEFVNSLKMQQYNKGPLCFFGTLGAGKTTFIRQMIRAFSGCNDLVVPSPTFNLVNEYSFDINGAPQQIWHADLYRITHPDECLEIGLIEAMHTHLCLIEWPENMGHWLPSNRIDITITIPVCDSNDIRNIMIQEIK